VRVERRRRCCASRAEQTSKRYHAAGGGRAGRDHAFWLRGYVLYGVGVEGDKTLNAVFFERVADCLAAEGRGMRVLLVVMPLVAEALLLVVAAQTGFSDGRRARWGRWPPTVPAPVAAAAQRRLISTERGIVLVGAGGVRDHAAGGGTAGPLVAIFVTCVFVTVPYQPAGDAQGSPLTAGHRHAPPGVGVLIHGTGRSGSTMGILNVWTVGHESEDQRRALARPPRRPFLMGGLNLAMPRALRRSARRW
jgi:hypothetical protein